ncbi:MAG: exosortase A [Thiohalocapsa sp.]
MFNTRSASKSPATGNPAQASAVSANWAQSVLLLTAAVSIVVILFRDTAWSIVSIWERSETFAHGYLIVPISLWLVWEKRRGLKGLMPKPTLLPVLLFLPIGFGWLVAYLVDTLVVQQFGFVAMLAVAIWALIGHRVASYLAFPILFLFLGVPVGEGLIYPMMNFTADFTVGMLEITGIPVYREGTFFTIPSGRWSVVEACSGVRYLIASVTLGVLFAYLTYTAWWKRLLFLVFSICVPILANGLRAYMIVMLGHLGGMDLAMGVVHLIYGWVFFGIVVTIMFLIGSLWRDPAGPEPAPDLIVGVQETGRKDGFRVLSFLVVAAAFWPALGWGLSEHEGAAEAVAVSAPVASEWVLVESESLWDWRPRIVGADGSIYAFYEARDRDDRTAPVGLYLGLYRTQRQGAELVSSGNMMLEQEHPVWSDTQISPRKVRVGTRNFSLQEHRLASRLGERLLVWTWYLVGGHHTANPYVAKLLEVKSWLLGRHGEAALIAVAAPYVEDEHAAEQILLRFLGDMLPAIHTEIARSLAPSQQG